MKYLFPCKPNALGIGSSFLEEVDRSPSWIAEVKKNGWRCLVYRESGVVLWTRHKTVIDDPSPLLRDCLLAVPEQTVLDGEFLHHRTADVKGHLYLFDVLIFRGKLITHFPLRERRKRLEEVGSLLQAGDSVTVAQQTRVGKKQLYYESIKSEENEGIVLKKLDSIYPVSDKRCLQNPFWLKVKKLEKHVYSKEAR